MRTYSQGAVKPTRRRRALSPICFFILLICLLMLAPTYSAAPPGEHKGEVIGIAQGSEKRLADGIGKQTIPNMPRIENPVRFELKFEKGSDWFAESITETKQVAKVKHNEVKQEQICNLIMKFTPHGVDGAGNGVMQLNIIAVKQKIDIAGVVLEVDSTNDGLPSNPCTLTARAMVESEFRYHITPHGEIVKFHGAEQLIAKLETFHSGPLRGLLQKSFGDDVWKRMLSAGSVVPKRAVESGDCWSNEQFDDFGGMGRNRTNSTFKYVGKKGNNHRITLASNVNYEMPKQSENLGFTIRSGEIKSSIGGGEILFDAVKGQFVSSVAQMNLTGMMTIVTAGVETDAGFQQTQATRLRVTDTNLLAKSK